MDRPEPYRFSRGASLSHKTATVIPADEKIRPLRDQIIVQPLDGNLSAVIQVIHECRPVRGIVKAVGPGTYHNRYDHPEKHKRTKVWKSKQFTPTEVKVGDTVELGGSEIGGYAFGSFYWGEKLHLICSERDVCGIVSG